MILAVLTCLLALGTPPASRVGAELDRALQQFEEGQQLLHHQPDRARQLFRTAGQRLDSIIATGVTNGYLEYNLGNCYLQAGDLGSAILHYRRAQKLIPGDPMLADNLSLARSRCLTQIQPGRREALLRNVFFWHYQTSESWRASVGMGLYLTAFGLLTARTFARRRWLSVLAATAGAGALACGGSVAAERWAERNEPAAVVTAMDVVVYKGPGSGYQRQFEQPLQPGVECVVVEQRDRWWQVELADGNRGWVEASSAEMVSPRLEAQHVIRSAF